MNGNELETLTFVHVFKACTQDNNAVIAVMSDVVKQLKDAMPELEIANYRQDNAGCYHNGPTIFCASQVGKDLGVKIKRLDFSDPQAGKGACDRKAASIKAHMQLYLNSGHDIETAEQMCEAMLSSSGIPSMSVTLCNAVEVPSMPSLKLDGISALYNVQFQEKEINVWRAYGVGKGQKILQVCSLDNMPIAQVVQTHPSEFSPISKPRRSLPKPKEKEDSSDKQDDNLEPSNELLFSCPEDGCIRTFMNHHSMIQHLDCGKHQRKLERETIYDIAAQEYSEHLEGQGTLVPQVCDVSSTSSTTIVHRQPKGWALKSRNTGRSRFTEVQKNYLTAKFIIGEQTGIKLDPAGVARSMMSATGPDGELLFTSDDFLTAKQIAGFFSRLASKKSIKELDVIKDVEIAAQETDLEAVFKEAAFMSDITCSTPFDNQKTQIESICEMT